VILPTDLNCMGYVAPAAIGAKARLLRSLRAGAFMMTCMGILTAAINNFGVVYCVFHDSAALPRPCRRPLRGWMDFAWRRCEVIG
jgi:thiamine pyrophosphate-dependent acetolactate synthase large subunit-like protein